MAGLIGLALWQAQAADLPAGTLLEIRLRQGLHSYTAKAGQSIDAVVAAPVLVEGQIAIPAGSRLSGTVREVKRVGIGFVHERATLSIEFNHLQLKDSAPIPVRTRIFQLENAREKLDRHGRVKGIRSTNTPGFRAAGVLTGLAAVDPIAMLFSATAFSATLRFSDPEIDWAPGAEMIVELLDRIETQHKQPVEHQPISRDPMERAELHSLVRSLPHRTARMADGKPSDLTNIMLIGKPEAIAAAFAAAGWVESMPSNASTRYRSLRAFAETQPYQEAPMSELTLDGEPAVLTLSKTLNTFTRRHHLRLYAWRQTWDGLPIFQAAATHDTDIIMSLRQRTITHEIDSNIDEERAKVVNDLMFTGCVDGAESITRPWIETSLHNGSGQAIESDRNIAVLRLNNCDTPDEGGVAANDERPQTANGFERTTRHALLRIRNDVIRGNLIWQGVSWAYHFRQMLKKKNGPVPRTYLRQTLLASADPAIPTYDPRSEDGSSMVAPLDTRPAMRSNSGTLGGQGGWGTPTVELGFSFGTSLFCQSTVGEEAWIFARQQTPGGPLMSLALTAGNQIRPGWAMGGTVTVHGTRWLSNEFGFHYQRGSFLLGLDRVGDEVGNSIPGIVEKRAGLLTRQFSYSTIVNLRPIESRLRPYLAAGPALQLVHLTDAPFEDNRGVFRLGLSNVGMIRSAYNFNNAPPLDGGGIFQPGFQFGGGIKYRYRNCWILRVDFRNTISHRPDLLRKSIAPIVDDIQPIPNARTHEWYRQQRVSVGFSFTF